MKLATTCSSKLILFWNGPLAFCAEELLTVPLHISGVYVLCAFTPARPLLVPFYVGQSADLQRRLGEHLRGTQTFARHLRNRLSTYFSLAVVSDPEMRTAAETALIRQLTPAGNVVVPRAAAIETTYPPLRIL